MADFRQAFELMIAHEGGYVDDPDDLGGETYKGVARKIWTKWLGWHIIDLLKKQSGFPSNLDTHVELQAEIETFYRVNFWNKIKGDEIQNQEVASSIFDFAVNTGSGTSIEIAQKIVGAKADGIAGNETISKINAFDSKHLLDALIVAKIRRYVSIVKKRETSRKYFYGWVIRAINE